MPQIDPDIDDVDYEKEAEDYDTVANYEDTEKEDEDATES